MDFNMKIIDNFDFVLEEKGNSFTSLRKLKWSDNSDTKLDIRKYMINSDGDEVIGKGVGFMTENGPNELVKVLIENDYGKTEEILNAVKDRKDFMSNLGKVLSDSQLSDVQAVNPDLDLSYEEDEDIFYDPRELVNE